MRDPTKISLSAWLPIVLSLLTLIGVAMALGRKDAKLDELSESIKDVAPLRIDVEVLKANQIGINSKLKDLVEKQKEILEEVRKQ